MPTNTTSRSSGSIVASAAAASAAERSNELPVSAASSVAARRVCSVASPSRAGAGARGAKRSMSTPGGPRRVRSRTVGSSIAAHKALAVWREPTRIPRAPSRPSRAYGMNRGYGLTVYSSALPWILTAYGTPACESARASTAGPITRWLASATSGRTRSATSRTAATLPAT